MAGPCALSNHRLHRLRTQRGGRFRKPSVIPGFGLTLGFTLVYLTLIILIPLSALVWRSAALGWAEFCAIATDRAHAAMR